MIKMLFQKGQAFFIVTIDNKKVIYWDKINGKRQLFPDIEKRATRQEIEQWRNAENDNALKEIILNDMEKNNYKLVEIKDK